MRGDLFQPECGVGFCFVDVRFRGERERLGKKALRVRRGDGSGQADARNGQAATAFRNLPDSLAHQGGWVDRSFTGDHQIGPAQMIFEICLAGKQLKSILQAGAQKCG